MTNPSVVREKRYGMFVHANIATVPAFAPDARVRRLVLGLPRDQARHRVAPHVPAARGRRLAPRALRRPAVRRLHSRPHVRSVRCRRVRAAPRRRGHALPRARHQAPRRLLLVGHRAHQPQFGGARTAAATWSPSSPTRCGAAATCSAVTTRCSTGATPTIPTPSATSTRSCGRRSRSSSSGSSRRCSGATGTGVIPAGTGAPTRSSRMHARTRRRTASRSCCNDRFFASEPDFVTFEYDVPAVPPDRLVGGVSRARVVVLRQSQRERRRLPDRARDRRDARRDGRQGRQPVAQHRAECRRHLPRSDACCATRARGSRASADPSDERGSTFPERRALVHAHRRRRARVRSLVGPGTSVCRSLRCHQVNMSRRGRSCRSARRIRCPDRRPGPRPSPLRHPLMFVSCGPGGAMRSSAAAAARTRSASGCDGRGGRCGRGGGGRIRR